jgi:hypothetical protein
MKSSEQDKKASFQDYSVDKLDNLSRDKKLEIAHSLIVNNQNNKMVKSFYRRSQNG